MATGDLVIQSFAEEIAKLDGGKEFLDLWETVYLVGGIVTSLPMLGALLRAGGRLLVLASGKVLEQLVVMLKYAVLWITDFPRLVKGTLEIVVDFVKELGRFAGQMQELARHGAMLVKGVVEGDTIPTYYLMFRNAILESGSLEEMGVALKRIVEEGKADLARFLERMFWMKSGTGGGYKYITEVPSSRIFGQEQPLSCSAACIRQIAKDHGTLLSEDVAREAAKTDGFRSGTGLHNVKPGLQKILPQAVIDGGLQKIASDTIPEVINAALNVQSKTRYPWIASFQPVGRPRHTVIVDKISEGIVYLRDPWGVSPGYGVAHGMEATMKLEDFAEIWTLQAVYISKI